MPLPPAKVPPHTKDSIPEEMKDRLKDNFIDDTMFMDDFIESERLHFTHASKSSGCKFIKADANTGSGEFGYAEETEFMDPDHPVYILHSCVDVTEEYTAVSSHTHFSGSYGTKPTYALQFRSHANDSRHAPFRGIVRPGFRAP